MSRNARGRDRKILAYADGLEHGEYGDGTVRTLAETHRLPHLVGCYALFAAHGGSTAADICARNFMPALLEDENFSAPRNNNSKSPGSTVRPLVAIENAIAAMEAFISSKSSIDRLYYGTTFAFVCVRDGRIYSSNVGDSRAVLATTDSAIRLTEDHSITSISEARRVKRAGAFFADGKINGLIHYTRSLGDLHFKARKHIYFPNMKSTNRDHILSATPHLAEHVLGVDALFIILGSEQIWRVLSDNAVCALVKASRAKNEPPRMAARRVVQAAISAGADPISSSALVVLLDDSNPLSTRDRYSNITSPRSSARHRNLRNSGNTNTSASSSTGIDPAYLSTPPRTKRVPHNLNSHSGTEDDLFGSHMTPPPRRSGGGSGGIYSNHGDRSPATPRNQRPLALNRSLSDDDGLLDGAGSGMTMAITSPTTPPAKRKPRSASKPRPRSRTSSASTRNSFATVGDLYIPSGRGRKQRVLVPIANWGVAPGGNEPLKNILVLPDASAIEANTADEAASGSSHRHGKKKTSARKPRSSRSRGPTAADAIANDYNQHHQPQHPISPPLKTNGDREPIRQDSFGVHSSLFTPPRPKRSSSAPRSSVAKINLNASPAQSDGANNARVSHVTTSSGKTAGTSTELMGSDNLNNLNLSTGSPLMSGALDELPGAELGRGGPAKVRYREHDIFGFLRRRNRPASRHG